MTVGDACAILPVKLNVKRIASDQVRPFFNRGESGMYRTKASFALGRVGFALTLISVMLSSQYCFAVTTVTVSPSTYTLGDKTTVVTVQANTAAAGNELTFDVYIDVDGDGTIDPADNRFMGFEVADGQAPHLGNADYWRDVDGAVNSSVKARLVENGVWWFSGHFIVKVTDENASTAKASFTVVQDSSYPCVITGEVEFEGAPAGGAIVQVVDMTADQELSMAVTAADGTFELRVEKPGQYGVYAFQVGAVTKFEEGSAGILAASAGSNPLPDPLVVFPGNRTISGRVFRTDTDEALGGKLVSADAERFFGLAVTNNEGVYTLVVVDGVWDEVSLSDEQIARLGCVPPAERSVTISGSDVADVDFPCDPATTLITGVVKDAETQQGLPAYSVIGNMQGGDDGTNVIAYTRADGSYALGVIEGDWWVDLEEDRLIGTGYADPPNQPVHAPPSGTVSGIDFLLEKAGTITGHVYEDDGVTPVERANVDAYVFGTWTFAAYTETLPDGSYTLWVPSGTYMVRVREVEGWFDQYYLNGSVWTEASPVVVSAPSETGGIDFVLARAGYISGHVYQEDATTAILGAAVEACVFGTWNWVARDDTEADGSYRLEVPSGSYLVRARGVCGSSDQYFDGAVLREEATRVDAIEGQETAGIDFILQPGATIKGHVYQAGGTVPVEGAYVSAQDATSRAWIADAQTGWDGSYCLSVPSGSYKVRAGADGWLPEYYLDTYLFSEASTITLTVPQTRTGVDFTPAEARTGIAGHLYRNDGTTPVAGASVSANDYATDSGMATVQTAADGSYTLWVPPGRYRVSAWAADWPFQYYNGKNRREEATPVTVPDEQIVPDIDFVFELGGKILGYVYQADGKTPIAGAWVNASDTVTGESYNSPPSGADGSYTIVPASGSYKLWASAAGWVSEYYDNTHNAAQATLVTVLAPEEKSGINFALEAASATIKGHVYQSDGGTPIAGVQVYARDYGTGAFMGGAESGADGSYTLRVPPGTFALWTWKLHYATQFYDHKGSSSEATPVTLSGSQILENVDFSLEWIPVLIDRVQKSASYPGALEVRWSWLPGMRYFVYWAEEMKPSAVWREVSDADKDIVKEGLNGGFMTWTDKGTAPGMNGNRPGDPGVRQRFYRIEEELQ